MRTLLSAITTHLEYGCVVNCVPTSAAYAIALTPIDTPTRNFIGILGKQNQKVLYNNSVSTVFNTTFPKYSHNCFGYLINTVQITTIGIHVTAKNIIDRTVKRCSKDFLFIIIKGNKNLMQFLIPEKETATRLIGDALEIPLFTIVHCR
jgi:hypothetical protein